MCSKMDKFCQVLAIYDPKRVHCLITLNNELSCFTLLSYIRIITPHIANDYTHITQYNIYSAKLLDIQ